MRVLGLCLCVAALGACALRPTATVTAPPVADVKGVGEAAPSRAPEPPVFSLAVLPSIQATGILKLESGLLQRPMVGSVQLRSLPAGVTVQVLGALDNADGQWLSVGLDDLQGWVRAAEIELNR